MDSYVDLYVLVHPLIAIQKERRQEVRTRTFTICTSIDRYLILLKNLCFNRCGQCKATKKNNLNTKILSEWCDVTPVQRVCMGLYVVFLQLRSVSCNLTGLYSIIPPHCFVFIIIQYLSVELNLNHAIKTNQQNSTISV